MTMIEILLSPGAAFRRIKQRPSWVLPLTIVLIFTAGITVLSSTRMERSKIRDRVEQQMRERQIPEEQIQRQLEQFDRVGGSPVFKYVVPVFSAVMITVIMLLISALILNWIVPAVCGAEGVFGLTFSVVSWAAMVRVVGAIIRALLVILRGPEQISTGLLLLFPKLNPGLAHALLNGIDFFAIWETLLIALGLKVVYDLKGRSVYFYVLLLWLLSVVLMSLFALIPGAGGMGV